MKLISTSVFISAFILTAGAALAHKYDSNKPVTLTGTVGKVEWHKPYVKIHLEVKDQNGKMKDWEVETRTPTVLESAGNKSTEIKKGDQITVQGSQEKNGTAHALASSITMADNRTVAITAPQEPEEVASATPAPAVPAPAPAPSSDSNALPRTASDAPLIGLIGLAALGGSALLFLTRRLS